MQVQFISSMSVITPDPDASRALYVDALRLPLKPAGDDVRYVFSEQVAGSRHFGVWPLSEAAEACFETPDWPTDRPVPQASIEFEVESEAAVSAAAHELEGRGFVLLHPTRTEPWGQTVARVQTLEGLIVGLSYAPWMHESAE
ncbi:MAG: hypothetical protein ACR2JU_07815 [Nocardioidaceae bacterium]